MEKSNYKDKSLQVGCLWLIVMWGILIGFVLCAEIGKEKKEQRIERVDRVHSRVGFTGSGGVSRTDLGLE